MLRGLCHINRLSQTNEKEVQNSRLLWGKKEAITERAPSKQLPHIAYCVVWYKTPNWWKCYWRSSCAEQTDVFTPAFNDSFNPVLGITARWDFVAHAAGRVCDGGRHNERSVMKHTAPYGLTWFMRSSRISHKSGQLNRTCLRKREILQWSKLNQDGVHCH